MTKMTENGICVCPAGEERYEYFSPANFNRNKKRRCDYDYRTLDGELFFCIAPPLEECRKKRDEWMKNRQKNEN